MTELAATIVQRSTEQIQDGVSGSAPSRITKFKLKITKAAQNDTVITTSQIGSSYTTDKVVSMHGVVIPASGDTSQETLTLDDSADEIVLAGAITGTAWVTIEFTE